MASGNPQTHLLLADVVFQLEAKHLVVIAGTGNSDEEPVLSTDV